LALKLAEHYVEQFQEIRQRPQCLPTVMLRLWILEDGFSEIYS